MKRMIFTLLVFILLVHPVFAEEVSSVNGNYWKNMSQNEKVFYLVGFTQGLAIAISDIDPSKLDSETYKFYPKEASGRSFNSMIQSLDKFYADYRNSAIAVPFALEIINMERNGATEDQINKYRKAVIETNP